MHDDEGWIRLATLALTTVVVMSSSVVPVFGGLPGLPGLPGLLVVPGSVSVVSDPESAGGSVLPGIVPESPFSRCSGQTLAPHQVPGFRNMAQPGKASPGIDGFIQS